VLEQIVTVKLLALIATGPFLRPGEKPGTFPAPALFRALSFRLGFWQLTSFMVTVTAKRPPPSSGTTSRPAPSPCRALFSSADSRVSGYRRHRVIDVAVYACCAIAIAFAALQLVVSTVVPGTAGYFVPPVGCPMVAYGLAAYLVWAQESAFSSGFFRDGSGFNGTGSATCWSGRSSS